MKEKNIYLAAVLFIALFVWASFKYGPDNFEHFLVFLVDCPAGDNSSVSYSDKNTLFISNRPTSMEIDARTGKLISPIDPSLVLKLSDKKIVTGRYSDESIRKIGIKKSENNSDIEWTNTFDKVVIAASDDEKRIFFFMGKRLYVKDSSLQTQIHRSEFGFSPRGSNIIYDKGADFIGADSGWNRFEFIVSRKYLDLWKDNFKGLEEYFKIDDPTGRNSSINNEYSSVVSLNVSSACINPQKSHIAYYETLDRHLKIVVRSLESWSIVWSFNMPEISRLALFSDNLVAAWPGRHSSFFMDRLFGAGGIKAYTRTTSDSAKEIFNARFMPGVWAGFSVDGDFFYFMNSLKGRFEAYNSRKMFFKMQTINESIRR
jgi:hypothetical protein